MTENTRDLTKFGYVQLHEGARLLTALCDSNPLPGGLGNGVALEFNPNTGNVFLVDEDYNVAMMNGDKLAIWHNCAYCGHEGFIEDFDHEGEEECKEAIKNAKEMEGIE